MTVITDHNITRIIFNYNIITYFCETASVYKHFTTKLYYRKLMHIAIFLHKLYNYDTAYNSNIISQY